MISNKILLYVILYFESSNTLSCVSQDVDSELMSTSIIL